MVIEKTDLEYVKLDDTTDKFDKKNVFEMNKKYSESWPNISKKRPEDVPLLVDYFVKNNLVIN